MANGGIRGWLEGVFVENGSYKLLSLALVIIVYSWIMGEKEAQTSAFADVRMVVPEQLVLTSAPVDRVKVTVQGRRSAIKTFNKKPMEPIVLDLIGFWLAEQLGIQRAANNRLQRSALSAAHHGVAHERSVACTGRGRPGVA